MLFKIPNLVKMQLMWNLTIFKSHKVLSERKVALAPNQED